MQVDNITLPDYKLQWVNKLQFSPLAQTSDYSTNGANIVERSSKLAGLPINLESGKSGFSRALLESLVLHANTKTTEFTLTLTDGSTHTVIWNIQDDGTHVTGDGLFRHDKEPDEQIMTNIKLRFITYVA